MRTRVPDAQQPEQPNGVVASPFSEPEPPPQPAHATGVQQITVTWGEEAYYPIQYNGFRVGGVSMTVSVMPNETIEEAYARVWNMLDALCSQQFEQKLAGFQHRLGRSAHAMRAAAGRAG